ncbi:N-acetylneuraminate lyase [Gonioctena quinquepunctata]|nr:N-acetylneuraminate lyase [Gonioctena quinquepunctata]
MVKLTFRGLCAAAFTAFRNDMSLNLEIIPSYAKYLFDSGINAVLVNGSTGEGMSLSISERKAVAEEWVKAVKPTKQHVMIQVGGCLFPHVLELAKHAETIGADSILCLPELYYSPKTSKQLIRYLKHVGDAAPRTPLLYYHNPKMTGVDLNMRQFMDEAAKELPTFQGIKFTSIDLDGAASALKANNGQYAVFLGTNTVGGHDIF